MSHRDGLYAVLSHQSTDFSEQGHIAAAGDDAKLCDGIFDGGGDANGDVFRGENLHGNRLFGGWRAATRYNVASLASLITQVGRVRLGVALARGVGSLLLPTLRCSADVVKSVDAAPPPVPRLLFGGRPSAITRLVVAVVVDSLDRVPVRPRPHVAQERRKVVSPLVAHADAAPAVVGVAGRCGIVATLFRVLPRPIFRASGLSVCSLMGKRARHVNPKAAATARPANPQSVAGGFDLAAAVASTEPPGFRIFGVCSSKDDKATEPPPGKGNHGWHAHILRCVGVVAKR